MVRLQKIWRAALLLSAVCSLASALPPFSESGCKLSRLSPNYPSYHRFSDVKGAVGSFFDSGGKLAAMPEPILSVVTKETLRNVLTQALANEELLKQIAAGSYRHPLGMIRLTIAVGPKDQGKGMDWGILLHLWDRKLAITEEGKHYHRFDLISSIIKGSVKNNVYQMAELSAVEKQVLARAEKLPPQAASWMFTVLRKGQVAAHQERVNALLAQVGLKEEDLKTLSEILTPHRIQWDPNQQRMTYEALPPVAVRAWDSMVMKAGDTYFHPAGLPHEAEPLTDSSVTWLVKSAAVVGESPRFLSPGDTPQNFDVTSLSLAETRGALQETLRRLDEVSPQP